MFLRELLLLVCFTSDFWWSWSGSVLFHDDENDSHKDANDDDHGDQKRNKTDAKASTNAHTVTPGPTQFCPVHFLSIHGWK